MKKINLLLTFLLLTVFSFGQLSLTVPTLTATPGATISIPVTLSGAGSSGTPISGADISVTYDTAVLSYDTIINFYAGMPASQWYYSGNFSSTCNAFTASSNWLHPSLGTIAIPDGTILYEIRFVYKGGSSPLTFCVYDFLNAAFDIIPTTPVNGSVGPEVVPLLSGPENVCTGATGNVYTTDAGQSNYNWNVNGGTITAGGGANSNTVTVTWPAAGSNSVSVSYTGSTLVNLPVSVNPLLPVSVAITASANQICAGTSVTFTATPVNGGSSPVYQWKKNGANVGSNAVSYTYAPAYNDVITCELTSTQDCATGNPATSNSITMTVNATVNASVSITASQNPTIAGTTVNYTALPVNGGTTPAYQWKVNGVNAGTSTATYSYVPANGDVVFCLLTTSLPCVNNLIATSNLITMVVNNPVVTPLVVTLPNKVANPGDVLYYPVKLKGASSVGVPISSANIQISYDPAVLHYDTLVSFYSATPSTQWFFSGNNNTVAANWMEPSLLTLAIPDSTTLFEIKFTYINGNDSLPFIVSEFTDASFEFIPTTHIDGSVSLSSLTGPTAVCQGSAGNIYTTNAGQSNYQWDANGGTITSGGGPANNTVTVTWPSAGSHSVNVTFTSGPLLTLPVMVSSPVIASSSAGTIACNGGTTTVIVSATGGTPPYTGTGAFTKSAGYYTFTVTDVNGCSGTTTITITEPPLFTFKSTILSANGAEISAFDSATNRIFTVAGPVLEYYTLSNSGVISGQANMPFGFTPPAGTTAVPNSVAVKNGVVAASFAIKDANNAQQPGIVAFYSSATAAYISHVTVGYLPDMITFTPDGSKVLTADEGEPNSYGQPTSFDPEGSVSIIDISGGLPSATVTTAGFTSYNGQLAALKAAGVRIYGPGATVAMDLEPEYLSFSADGTTAYVTLQENNAVAKLNISTATITDIYPLGLKDYSLAGNGLDASDRDVNGTSGGGGKINIQNWPVKGMYEPDGIASFTSDGNTYYLTANEGDARDYTGYTEEVRVSDASYILDPVVFPNASTLKQAINLGRLNVSKATGNTDGDTQFEEIHSLGARSFTVWNSSFTKMFDSQDQLEQITAARYSTGFNSDGTAATFDTRSDNKGPEPEGLAVGTVNGVQYAFIGSERTGDIFIYDLSDPTAPLLKQYINTPADLGVEGIQFVSASQSPTGKALIITSSEVSKTVTVYEFMAAPVITLTGNTMEQICLNSTYNDAGATAVDYQGNNITGSIMTDNPVNTAVPGTYTVTYNVTDACGIAALPVTRSVNVIPISAVGVSIAVNENPVCNGVQVTITATPTNGGNTPLFQWKKNGINVGTNNTVFSYVPANNDVITCELFSSDLCATGNPATSNSITMMVQSRVNVSVSVTASQNPTIVGTTVNFTALPVNGGSTPIYQWKVNGVNVGANASAYSYSPANGDVVLCLMTTSLTCVNNMIATSNLITMVVNNPPVTPLLVTLPDLTAMPGDVIYFPVKLKGADNNGEPISSANIQISYDPAILQYDTLVNFYNAMPASQWFFSGNNNTVAANWIEPSLLTLSIPDSTTLFEIQFTYLGGETALPFVINEFTDNTFEFIATTHIDGSVNQLVPNNTEVENVIVENGNDTCFNAIQTLTVAGGGTTFAIHDGGSATFVAGQKISFMPGTTIFAGGYLHGYITQEGQYCGQLPNMIVVAKPSQEETTFIPEIMSHQSVKVYPNPTTGIFTVEVNGEDQAAMIKAEIYSMGGIKVFSVDLASVRKHEFSLARLKPGIYFIHVFTNERSEILKMVKF